MPAVGCFQHRGGFPGWLVAVRVLPPVRWRTRTRAYLRWCALAGFPARYGEQMNNRVPWAVLQAEALYQAADAAAEAARQNALAAKYAHRVRLTWSVAALVLGLTAIVIAAAGIAGR